MSISVLIPVKNEGENIRECLESVRWSDDVYVVDSQSRDRTVEIAKAFDAEVHQFHYERGWPKKKNWALENLDFKHEWVLILDADERVTPDLRDEMLEAVGANEHSGYYIRWKLYFLGREMKHCWDHGWMLRLFRHRMGRYEYLGMTNEGGWDVEVHENVVLGKGTAGRLKNPLVHQSRKDLSYWLSKQNDFSDWNAKLRLKGNELYVNYGLRDLMATDANIRRKALKRIFLRLPFKSALLFLYLYLWKRGFLDGREGYYFCRLRAQHEFHAQVKMFELKNRPAGQS